MGALSLSPAEIDKKFSKLIHTQDFKAATDWFYDYCVSNDYVKKAILDRNPRFSRDGLIITINLAKPEFRDPNNAKSGNAVQGGYPACVICRENEGFTKRGKRTLRTVSVKLNGKDWFWQYSPYGYFRQHGIAVNYEHTPMHVDKATFGRLMDFADRFPHYFIGRLFILSFFCNRHNAVSVSARRSLYLLSTRLCGFLQSIMTSEQSPVSIGTYSHANVAQSSSIACPALPQAEAY